jgi:hypothetical protein
MSEHVQELEQLQDEAPREGSETPAAIRMRAWRAAQSPQAKERRRLARQRTRDLERENIARRHNFALLSPEQQRAHRQRDCDRHAVPRRARMLQRDNDEVDELVAAHARLEQDAADAAAAEAAADAGAGEEANTKKRKAPVEVSAEVELSQEVYGDVLHFYDFGVKILKSEKCKTSLLVSSFLRT